MAKFYAVKQGRRTGIFTTWAECQEQIKGFSGAIYKSFPTEEEAKSYIGGESLNMFREEILESPIEKSSDFMDYLEIDTCVAYVDGSNTNGTVGSGVVMMFGSGTSDEKAVAARNVAGEINSAMIAMHTAKLLNKRKVTIIYDYAGIEQWALGNWEARNDLSKGYKRFYDSITQHIEVEFIKVKGHTGVPGNEFADKVSKRMAGVL